MKIQKIDLQINGIRRMLPLLTTDTTEDLVIVSKSKFLELYHERRIKGFSKIKEDLINKIQLSVDMGYLKDDLEKAMKEMVFEDLIEQMFIDEVNRDIRNKPERPILKQESNPKLDGFEMAKKIQDKF